MSGGYQKYLRNVIPRMAAHRETDAILCASPKSLNVQEWFEPIANVKFIDCKPFRFLRHNPDPQLRGYLKKFRPDVIFIPLERYVRFEETPVVNMVRNMEPLSLLFFDNNPFIQKVINLAQYRIVKHAVIKSQRTIAVSGFVREFLVKKWNAPNDKIGLVYYGIEILGNGDFRRPDLVPKSWKGEFLFTAGSIRPARGLEDVLWAMRHLHNKSQDISGLVIAGSATSRMMKYRKQLEDGIQTQNLSSKVCWAGELNEKEMIWCYRNCKLFVMTSRVESFGMVACEAMAQGCICISADNPCLPELFGDAAIYYPAKDGDALAGVIRNVLTWDNHQRNKAYERARKRAAEFSWDVCAEKTIAELAKAAKDFNSLESR